MHCKFVLRKPPNAKPGRYGQLLTTERLQKFLQNETGKWSDEKILRHIVITLTAVFTL
jgi:hypothetical protein